MQTNPAKTLRAFGQKLKLWWRNIVMAEGLNPKLLEILACPRCLARLQYDAQHQRLICRYERLAYPIKNGVPLLLAEKAETLKE